MIRNSSATLRGTIYTLGVSQWKAAALICAGTSLVLLCACGDECACHRSSVAKLIQDALPAPTAAREVLA